MGGCGLLGVREQPVTSAQSAPYFHCDSMGHGRCSQYPLQVNHYSLGDVCCLSHVHAAIFGTVSFPVQSKLPDVPCQSLGPLMQPSMLPDVQHAPFSTGANMRCAST